MKMASISLDPPVQDCLVVVIDMNRKVILDYGFTDANGRVVLKVPAGTHKLVIAKEGYFTHEEIINIPETKKVTVKLARVKYVDTGFPRQIVITLKPALNVSI